MIKIIALTEAGHKLAQDLKRKLPDSEVCFKPKPFTPKVQAAFMNGDGLIMICATGIAVRCLAPVLQNKHQDPPVLVLDEKGHFVIPLLSGHEGGANDFALQVANILSAQLVMTTAKPYLKPIYTVGMGCERHCPKEYLSQLLSECLLQVNLSVDDISSVNSINIKADEIALIELSLDLAKPFNTWDTAQLGSMESLLSTKSDYIYNTVGVYGVAESAALYGAMNLTGDNSELVLNKHKNAKATCAIARSFPLYNNEKSILLN
jgi:cobalt-precorrin 5A hydrolase